MDEVTKQDLEVLLSRTPDTPENQALINMILGLLQRKKIFKRPFSYSTSFLAATFTAGATLTNNIPIQADSDFLILNQTYTADVARAGQTGATQTIPLATVILSNSGTGEQLMNVAVPVTQIFGNGQFPYVLPQPNLLPARANLVVQAQNIDAAQAYNLNLTFNGVKLYSQG